MSKWQYGAKDLAIAELKNAAKKYYEKLKHIITVMEKVLVCAVEVTVDFRTGSLPLRALI